MDITQQTGLMAPPEGVEELTPELARKRKSQLRLIGERFLRNKVAVVGLAIITVMAVLVIFAPIITHQTATYDPTTTIDLFHKLEGPSAAHPFGTDQLGRDVLGRLLFGGRVSLTIGITSALVALFVGVTVGALAGYYGGWLDTILMRITDSLLALPFVLIILVLSVVFSDGSVTSVVLIIGAFAWLYTARIVRAEFLALKEREFILAARTLGASDLRLILLHLLPNAAGPIIVNATLLIGANIITESLLSFFGFGLAKPAPSWGGMLEDSQPYIGIQPFLLWAPGLCILITVLAFNLIGDGLRDALDPYGTQR